MIGFLRGRVVEKQPNRILIDVHGVGYDVVVPLSTYYEIGDAGTEAALRVHTHVREDALQLYGFNSPLEQQLFERLISISGIGPKLAVSVLSGIETRELVGAVQRGDVARLTRVPGVGKKTAERIVLELKDRLAQIPAIVREPVLADTGDRLRADLLSALQNLGYQRPVADKAVEAALANAGGADLQVRPTEQTFEQALRAALRELMR